MPGIAIANSMAFGVSPPPWTPAAVPGCILYEGPYLESRATRAAQPSQTDLDMEVVGVANWPLRSGTVDAARVKDASVFHGGAQSLKITSSTANDGVNRGAAGVAGNRYLITGHGRGDGVKAPGVCIDGSAFDWTGTSSTNWQPVTAERTAANAVIGWLLHNAAGAGSIWFDDLTLANLSLTSYAPQFTTVAGSVLAQAGDTSKPWAGALGMMFDGDLMPWNAPASNVKCAHDGTGGSIGIAYRPTTLKAENRIFATAATAVGNVGVCVSCTNANTIRVRIMNGGGAYDYDSGDVACPIAINTTYAIVLRVVSGAGGASLRVNGTEVISGALTAPSAANPTTGLMLGGDAAGAATNVTGYVGQALVVQRAMTAAECAQYEAAVAAGGL